MASGDAPSIINDNGGGTAAVFNITSKHKQVAVTNYHATQTLHVKAKTGATSAAAAAAATADAAVIDADDVLKVGPGKREIVGKSGRRTYWSLSVIASGATTPFQAVGSDWTD